MKKLDRWRGIATADECKTSDSNVVLKF